MGEFVLVWLVAPALLLLLCFGVGLLLTAVTRGHKNFATVVSLGFVLVVVLGSVLTTNSLTASHASLIILIIALIGLLVSMSRIRSFPSFDYPSAISGLVTYVVFGLPVMAYGKPSWAGWVKLDDTASFFAVTNRIMTSGQSVPAAVTSSYSRIIQVLLGGNGLNYGSVTDTHFVYPVGSFIPYGVISQLTGIERAWLFQPYLALAAALTAMLFVAVLRRHARSTPFLIVASCFSIASSTIYSYVMWGGIKEIVIIIPLTLLALLLFGDVKQGMNVGHYLTILICLVALYFIGGMASFGFTVSILLIFVLTKMRSKNRFYLVVIPALFLALVIGVGTIYLATGKNIIGDLFVPKIKDPGNLSRSLNLFQTFGIWPSQDFRLDPVFKSMTMMMIAFALLFFLFGMYFSSKRHFWAIPSLVVSSIAVIVYSYFWGGIWLTGKTIAVASPLFLLASSVGAYELWNVLSKSERKWIHVCRIRYLGVGLVIVVGFGVLLSDAFTYKNVWVAPYSQMDELRTIGNHYSGQGPALMTEYSVFGGRYFLRNLDAESASELRVHLIPMSDGMTVPKGFAADISLFDSSTIDYFKLLVLRKSPTASRPPLNYQLSWSGQYYEVWKRINSSHVIKKTLSLGDNFTPGAQPTCSAVTSFLAQSAKGDRIFTALRDKTYLIDFSDGDLPNNWTPITPFSGAVNRSGAGGFSRQFSVDETRDYDLSIAGSFPGQMTLLIDGNQVYSGHSVIEGNPTLTNVLTRVHLSAGSHVLTVVYKTPLLMPGSDVAARFGPVYLSTQFAGDVKVKQVPISKIPQLCTQNLDWIAITN